jgi:uncharacterized protein
MQRNFVGKRLLVNLKIVERCNLNCTYCYFFNGEDQSYQSHPKHLSRDMVRNIAAYLKNGCEALNVTELSFIFHGGEPLIYSKANFDWMCTLFSETFPSTVRVRFSLQTNGILIDEKWAKLLLKHDVGVGISIDGPEIYNDKYRIDHKNSGSHQRVVSGLKNLKAGFKDKANSIGALCVINPEFSANIIYKHLAEDLKLKSFDFIIPDYNYDNPPPFPPEQYGQYLTDLFYSWVNNETDEDEEAEVRIMSSSIGRFFGFSSLVYGVGKTACNQLLPLMTISSNGDLGPLDELRSTDPKFREARKNIANTSLKDFFELSYFDEIAQASAVLPDKCQECCWSEICEGGGLVNRYSTQNKFNNPSIYCDGLKLFYSSVAKYLLENGYPLEEMQRNLKLNVVGNLEEVA